MLPGFVVYCRTYTAEAFAAAEASASLTNFTIHHQQLPIDSWGTILVAHRGVVCLGCQHLSPGAPSTIYQSFYDAALGIAGLPFTTGFRFCLRIVPVDAWAVGTGPNVDTCQLEQHIQQTIRTHLPQGGCTFAVMVFERGDDQDRAAVAWALSKLQTIELAAATAVSGGHQVDLRRPQFVISIVRVLTRGKTDGLKPVIGMLGVGVLRGRHCSTNSRLRPLSLPAVSGKHAAGVLLLPAEATVASRARHLFPHMEPEIRHKIDLDGICVGAPLAHMLHWIITCMHNAG